MGTLDTKAIVGAAILIAASASSAAAQSDAVDLVVESGRPLRVALADSATVRRVGQRVTGTVVEPVYAYDRIVIPAGTRVSGKVSALTAPGKWSRVASWLSGDFSPHRTIEIQFDALDGKGATRPMQTIAKHGTPRVARQFAQADDSKSGAAAAAARELKARKDEALAAFRQKAGEAVSAVREPGRLSRLKDWAIDRLPYHPQVLRAGTTYDAELQAPLAFGSAMPRAHAPEGSLPAPASILTARLATTLDSATAVRGTPLEAVVAEPVFADDGRLIFPEGTRLTGEVTFARAARTFHRNGQLRFLFERVQLPQGDEDAPLLASLHAIDASDDDRLVLDDEGGAAVANSKSRFVAPALAALALRASLRQGEGRGFETGTANVEARSTSASVRSGLGARGLGGFLGFGLLGAALAQISQPIGIGFTVYGVGRSVYTNILGRGQEVRFAADTPIQVQLAPGRSTDR